MNIRQGGITSNAARLFWAGFVAILATGVRTFRRDSFDSPSSPRLRELLRHIIPRRSGHLGIFHSGLSVCVSNPALDPLHAEPLAQEMPGASVLRSVSNPTVKLGPRSRAVHLYQEM